MGSAGWLALGVLAGLVCAVVCAPPPALLLAVGALGLAALAGALRGVGALDAVAPLLLGMVLGGLPAASRAPGPVAHGLVRVHGIVTGSAVGHSADVWAHAVQAPGADVAARSGAVRVRFAGTPPPPGSEVVVLGRAGRITSRALPGAPGLAWGARLAGIRTEVRILQAHAVGQAPGRRLPPGRYGGVLHALAWGDRTHLDPLLVARMRRTGTAHLLAISGFHVGLVAGAVGGLLRLLLHGISVARARGLPTRWVWLVGALAAWAYAQAAGAPIGALRSAWVLTGLAGLGVLGLQPRGLDLLAVAAAAVAMADPARLASPGFHLSFGAVLGLLRLTPALEAWRPRWWPAWLQIVWKTVSASIAATAGTLPAAAWWFQAVSWTSPLGNLVAGPMVSVLLVPLAAVHALGPAALDAWTGPLTDGVVTGLLVLLAPLDQAPIPLALGPVAAALLALALGIHRRWAWLLATLVALGPGPVRPRAGVRLTFPPVDAGASTLVEWDTGQRWLVDGGPSRERVLHWLRRRGVRRLDVVAATVGRRGHAGGLAAVVEHLEVGVVWLPPNSRFDPDLRELVSAAVARGVPVLPGPSADVSAAERAWLRDEGDRSLVLEVGPDGGPSALLPGDLGPEGSLRVATRTLAATVLHLPRHGGQVSGGAAAWPGWSPRIVVVQGSHPDEQVLQGWRRRGSRVWRTDLDGTIEVSLHPGQLRVRTWTWENGWRMDSIVDPRPQPWYLAGQDLR